MKNDDTARAWAEWLEARGATIGPEPEMPWWKFYPMVLGIDLWFRFGFDKLHEWFVRRRD